MGRAGKGEEDVSLSGWGFGDASGGLRGRFGRGSEALRREYVFLTYFDTTEWGCEIAHRPTQKGEKRRILLDRVRERELGDGMKVRIFAARIQGRKR